MISEVERLRSTIDEYQTLVSAAAGREQAVTSAADCQRLREALSADAEWTTRGAETILLLAKQYGTFVLRNALAMAIAMGIEDGEAGL